jgi:transcriptional regulator with XRE-family HTH domain
MEGQKLREYLAERGMKHAYFAKMINIGPSYLGQIINGKRLPGYRLSMDISRFTEGKVNLPWSERRKPEERKAEGE